MAISKEQPMRDAELDLIDAFNDANLDDIPDLIEDVADLQDDVSNLETTVGDNTLGLVKDVDDLQTTVGDNTAGLVKDVDDLQTTVGDNTAGLVKDVDDLQTDVTALETAVGDNTSGLVKDVADLKTHVPVQLVATNISIATNTTVAMPSISQDYSFLLFMTYAGSDNLRNTTIVPNGSNVMIPVMNGTSVDKINWHYTTSEIITPNTNSGTVNIRYIYGINL